MYTLVLRSPQVWALLMACAKDQKFCRQAVDADALPALAALLRRLPPASGGNVARCLHFLALRSPERCAAMQAAGTLSTCAFLHAVGCLQRAALPALP